PFCDMTCALSDALYLSFFGTQAPTDEIHARSLHDALPIWRWRAARLRGRRGLPAAAGRVFPDAPPPQGEREGGRLGLRRRRRRRDRKSTRLNSSHVKISYAVFCLKKKSSVYTSATVHRTA